MNEMSPLALSPRGSFGLACLDIRNPHRTRKATRARDITDDGDSMLGVEFTQIDSHHGNGNQIKFDWDGSDDKHVIPEQRTVLVVDDDQAIREALADVLGELGYGVVGAGDGQQALAYLQEGCKPFVILLDLGMPVMDGWEFRKELLKDPRFAGLPVVVITASRDQHAETLRVTDVLTKPVRLERLIEVLEMRGNGS